MVGRQSFEQPMFIYKRMEELIPEDHFLRKVEKVIDFSFVREIVKGLYSKDKGRPSIDPVVAIKNMVDRVFLRYSFREKVNGGYQG